jgi:hypothetical protein
MSTRPTELSAAVIPTNKKLGKGLTKPLAEYGITSSTTKLFDIDCRLEIPIVNQETRNCELCDDDCTVLLLMISAATRPHNAHPIC